VVEDHVRIGLVLGPKDYLAVTSEQALDRRLLTIDHRRHDVTFGGVGLATDDDQVAIEDAGVDHRVALDPKHEYRSSTHQRLGQTEDVLDVLGGQHRAAGGDPSYQWDLAHVFGQLRGGLGSRLPTQHLDGPGLGGIAADHARLDQRRQVAVDRGGRGEPHRLTDLAYRRGIAPIGDGGPDEVQDLSLTLTQISLIHLAAHGLFLSLSFS
jgi:hypothetical protein